jgi:hypothetical protein
MNSLTMPRAWTVSLAIALTIVLATELAAQSRLVGVRSASLGVTYESWRFSDGLLQSTQAGNDVLVDRAYQISFPLVVSVPLGEAWNVDLSAAYATSRVTLDGADSKLNVSRYSLSGLSDTRIRATGRVSPLITVTAGLTLPTGQTSLTREEYEAFRVLAAPALSYQVARLGNGVSGTAGIVASKELGGMWAGALGASYELHGSYGAGSLALLTNPDYSPGDALRFSLGLDGPVGQHGMTLGLSVDFYPNQDAIRDSTFASDRFVSTQLGPVLTADWQLRIASPRFRELTLYVVDRYRTDYGTGIGDSVSALPNSSGNYLDAGIRSAIPSGLETSIIAALNFRHQTGLDSDETISTARMVSGALTLGVARNLGSGYSVQPFIRGQVGRIGSGDLATTATGLAGGITLSRRF